MDTKQAQRTPVPWEAIGCTVQTDTLFGNSRFVALTATPAERTETDEANALFIVRACNAHDDLLKACHALVEAFDQMTCFTAFRPLMQEALFEKWMAAYEAGCAARAKAEGYAQ